MLGSNTKQALTHQALKLFANHHRSLCSVKPLALGFIGMGLALTW
jgi:hypothetical protein